MTSSKKGLLPVQKSFFILFRMLLKHCIYKFQTTQGIISRYSDNDLQKLHIVILHKTIV